jgi:hypothetical protein
VYLDSKIGIRQLLYMADVSVVLPIRDDFVAPHHGLKNP